MLTIIITNGLGCEVYRNLSSPLRRGYNLVDHIQRGMGMEWPRMYHQEAEITILIAQVMF
jgi:hypothetical protein